MITKVQYLIYYVFSKEYYEYVPNYQEIKSKIFLMTNDVENLKYVFDSIENSDIVYENEFGGQELSLSKYREYFGIPVNISLKELSKLILEE